MDILKSLTICICCMLRLVDCQMEGNIALLIENKNVTCAVGRNSLDEVLEIHLPLRKEPDKRRTYVKYTSGAGYSDDSWNCDFESIDQCNSNWVQNTVSVIHSTKFPTPPILDERWEKFTTFITRINVPTYNERVEVKSKNFAISFSVKSQQQAHVFLCAGPSPRSSKCYWIILEGFSPPTIYLIRRCNKSIPDGYPNKNNECMNTTAQTNVTKKFLNEENWTHYTVRRQDSNTIVLENNEYGDSPILQYTDPEPINVKYMFVRNFEKQIVQWKFHEYNYLSFYKKDEYVPLGPKLYHDGHLCVSLYVRMCPNCSLEFYISDLSSTQLLHNISSAYPQWKLVKIMWNSTQQSHLIYMIGKNKEKNGYWSIDDVRRCYADEVRYVSSEMKDPQEASCRSLKNFNLSVSNAVKKLEGSCPNVGYVGPRCDIPCLHLTIDHHCIVDTLCQMDAGQATCRCGPGHYGDLCNYNCPPGKFGYGCQECGKCNDNICDFITGNCTKGCEDNYAQPQCFEVQYPVFKHQPHIVNVTARNVTVQISNVDTEAREKAESFQIEFEENNSWVAYGERVTFAVSDKVTINNLIPKTRYKYRVILYTASGGHYKGKTVNFFYFNTHCEVQRPFHLIVKSKEIDVYFNESSEYCSLKSYNLLINNKNYGESLLTTTTLLGFKPYSDVTICLTYQDYSYKQCENIKTPQDAPEEVRNVNVKARQQSLSVSWDEPLNTNGIIQGYSLSYQRTRPLACATDAAEQLFEMNITSKSAELLGLIPYSRYTITITAHTVKQGPGVTSTADTEADELIEENELPEDFAVTATSKTLQISLDVVSSCSIRKGPLLFQVVATCVAASWCRPEPHTAQLQDGYVTLSGLVPYTNYSVQLLAVRGTTSSLHLRQVKEVRTLADAAPAVRDLAVYSRDWYFFGVRWRPPFPPHGVLQEYQIKICYYSSSCYLSTITGECTLFDGFICANLTTQQPNTAHTIVVSALNEGTQKGLEVRVTSTSKQGEPTAPQNLTYEWVDEGLQLRWRHPDITNGPLQRFTVTLELTQTEITGELDNKRFTYQKTVTAPEREYGQLVPVHKDEGSTCPPSAQCQHNSSILYSSTYNIMIRASTQFEGEAAVLTLDTPPQMPALVQDLRKVTAVSNTTISFVVPVVRSITKSKTCFVLVVVGEVSQPRQLRSPRNSPEIYSRILAHTLDPDHYWIAAELQPANEPITFVLGDGGRASSMYGLGDVFNKPLTPDTLYDISVVPVNVYQSAHAYKFYSLSAVRTSQTLVSESSNAALFALVLLVLVPVLLWLLYKYKLKKMIKSGSVQMIEEMNRSSAGTHRDPDVIPLTQPLSVGLAERTGPMHVLSKNLVKKTDVHSTPEPEISEHPSCPVPFVKFEAYVKKCLENTDFHEQHGLFKKGQTKPWKYGVIKPNKSKNRYNNLAAYDFNRVRLQKIPGDEHSDYINASYINGYKQPKAYIATQGPKATTLVDFWRMMWQERVRYVVMLANLIEGGKPKCEQYWPELESTKTYGEITVTHLNSDIYADYIFRTFIVMKGNEQLQVEQLHFTSWPDHGVPLYPQSMVPFLKKMLTIPQEEAPTVVHCSAGVGRTGTIILCDMCLRMAAREGIIDALKFLHELREQRANMVDNVDQYKLVHMVLLECLFTPETNIPCNGTMNEQVSTLVSQGGIQLQLNYLNSTSWQDAALNINITSEIDPANTHKNRTQDVVPVENRVFLSRYPTTDVHSDYINAVPVDGFRFKDQFIVTQNPLPNTLTDFWRMVKERTVRVIVSLNDVPDGDPDCPQFWLEAAHSLQITNTATVSYTKSEPGTIYNVHHVVIKDESEQDEHQKVTVIQFNNWNRADMLPEVMENLIHLCIDSENLSRNSHPMLVTCYDGCTASGVFIALSFVIEKIKLEQNCDVCLAVRVIRRNRKQFVTKKAQFEFLYYAAVAYVQMFETYSNFTVYKHN